MIWRIGGVPEHFNFPWRSPEAVQFLKSQGLRFEWSDYPGGTGAMIHDLLEDRLDLAVVLTEGFIAAAAAGKPLTLICPFVLSSLHWGVFVRKGAVSDTEQQFHRFAVSRLGSGSHLMALYWAKLRGWNPEECRFVICEGLAGAKRAIAEGEADYFLWEKYMTWPVVEAGIFNLYDEVLAPWMSFVVVARNELVSRQKASVLQWRNVLPGSCRLALQHLDAETDISKPYGIPMPMVREWLSALQYFDGLDNWRSGVQHAAERMQAYGMAGGSSQAMSLLD